MNVHPLTGHFSVERSAKRIRQYRYVEERLMRMLGGWIALTPEVPAKLVMGRHIWECAQHADAWGKRLPELREPAHQSEPANDRVARFMDFLEGREGPGETLERLTGVYRVLKPHLVATYERHLKMANAVYEPPTCRILTRCLDEERRHVAAGGLILRRLATSESAAARIADWEARLRQALTGAGGITGEGDVAMPDTIDTAGTRPEQDVVILDPAFDAARIEPALAAVLGRHAAAVAAGDWVRAERDVAADARSPVIGEYARLAVPYSHFEVVALAKIGALRTAKIRFSGPHGVAVAQVRCRRLDDDWRVVVAEIVRTEPAR